MLAIDKLVRKYERMTAAARFFQVASVVLLLYVSAAVIGLVAAGIWHGDISSLAPFFDIWLRAAFSSPSSAVGGWMKITMIYFIFGCFLLFLFAGALSAFERIGSALAAAFVLCAPVASLAITQSYLPSSDFLFLSIVAQMVSLALAIIVGIGAASIVTLPSDELALLRGMAKRYSFRSMLLQTFAIPKFVTLLGWRQFIVIPLFLLSAVCLASAMAPFVAAPMHINGLYQINQTICREQPVNLRQSCMQELMHEDAILLPLYIFVGTSLSLIAYRGCLFLARRVSVTSLRHLITRDRRPPVLFLRSFSDDQVTLPRSKLNVWSALRFGSVWKTLEELVLAEASAVGPVIAIGNPADIRAPFGAARAYVSDESWRDEVLELMERSQAIILCVDDSAGVKWEMEQIFERNYLSKSLFLMKPSDPVERAYLMGRANDLLRSHSLELPQESDAKNPIAIYWDSFRKPCLLTSQTTAGDAYTIVLAAFDVAKPTRNSHSVLAKLRNNSFTAALLSFLTIIVMIDVINRISPSDGASMHFYDLIGGASPVDIPGKGQIIGTSRIGSAVDYLASSGGTNSTPRLVWLSEQGTIKREAQLNSPPGKHVPYRLISGFHGQHYLAVNTADSQGRWNWSVRLLNDDGIELWRYTDPQKSDYAMVENVTAFPGGGAVVVGRSRENSVGSFDLFVMKLDAHGNRLWRFQDGIVSHGNWANAASVGDDGTIAVTGWIGGADRPGGDIVAYKFTTDGSVVWKRLFGERDIGESGHSIVATSDGGYVVGGSRSEHPGGETIPVVLKLDRDGAVLWRHDFSEHSGVHLKQVALLGSDVVLTGHTLSGRQKVVVARLSADGEKISSVETTAGWRRVSGLQTNGPDHVTIFGSSKRYMAIQSYLDEGPEKPWIARVQLKPSRSVHKLNTQR